MLFGRDHEAILLAILPLKAGSAPEATHGMIPIIGINGPAFGGDVILYLFRRNVESWN